MLFFVQTLLLFGFSEAFKWPNITITPIRPSGLKACIPDLPGVERFTFCGTIQPPPQYSRCDYRGSAIKASKGQWCVIKNSGRRGTVWHDAKDGDGVVAVLEYAADLVIEGEVHTSRKYTKNIKETDFEKVKNNDEGCNFYRTEKNSEGFDLTELRMNLSIKTQTCEERLRMAKEGFESVALQFGEINSNLARLELALDKSQAELAEMKRFSKEALIMIEASKGPKTNKLFLNGSITLEPHLPILHEIITNDVGIERSEYHIVNSHNVNKQQVLFELQTYSEKLKIYLHSRVRLKHTKLQILDYDTMEQPSPPTIKF